MNFEQQQAAKALRSLDFGDRRIAAALGLSYHEVRRDREKCQSPSEHRLAAAPSKGPKVLLYDIENTPSLCWVWNQFQTNVIATERDWHLLCFAYKWLGQKDIHFVSMFQDPNFEPDTTDDKYVAEKLAALFDEADVLVAHHGDVFDVRKANARFLFHGIDPPSPYRTIDTKKEAKRYTLNYSNSLNELGRLLKIGEKVEHRGFDLWRECMLGVPEAWQEMEQYNRGDVELLEKLYKKLVPWIGSPGHTSGLNYGLWSSGKLVCSKCGSGDVIKRGFHRTKVNTYRTIQCKVCGGYSQLRLREPQDDGGVQAV